MLLFAAGKGDSIGADEWQAYDKLTSLSHSTVNTHFTTMRAYNLAHNRQPETGAMMYAAGTGWVHLIKALKDMRQAFRRDARASIDDRGLDSISGRNGANGYPPTGWGVLQGVIDQVVEDLCQPVTVAW